MSEVYIMQEHQKKTKATRIWNSSTFGDLMEYNPLEAAKYAVDCGIDTQIYWMPVKEYIEKAEAAIEQNNIKKEEFEENEDQKAEEARLEAEAAQLAAEEIAKNALESLNKENTETTEQTTEETTTETTENIELSKEDLQELLKSNNIEFPGTLGQKKLLELAQKNNLL